MPGASRGVWTTLQQGLLIIPWLTCLQISSPSRLLVVHTSMMVATSLCAPGGVCAHGKLILLRCSAQDLVKEGKVKYIGLSECSPKDVRRAAAVHPIAALEMEWSLFSRDAEAELVPTARELGIGFLAYSPLIGPSLPHIAVRLLHSCGHGCWRSDVVNSSTKYAEIVSTAVVRLQTFCIVM